MKLLTPFFSLWQRRHGREFRLTAKPVNAVKTSPIVCRANRDAKARERRGEMVYSSQDQYLTYTCRMRRLGSASEFLSCPSVCRLLHFAALLSPTSWHECYRLPVSLLHPLELLQILPPLHHTLIMWVHACTDRRSFEAREYGRNGLHSGTSGNKQEAALSF